MQPSHDSHTTNPLPAPVYGTPALFCFLQCQPFDFALCVLYLFILISFSHSLPFPLSSSYTESVFPFELRLPSTPHPPPSTHRARIPVVFSGYSVFLCSLCLFSFSFSFPFHFSFRFVCPFLKKKNKKPSVLPLFKFNCGVPQPPNHPTNPTRHPCPVQPLSRAIPSG